jgi:hypothetical protein
VQSITGADFELRRDGDAWKLADANAEAPAPLDEGKVDELVSTLDSLRVMRAVDGLPEGARVAVTVATEDATLQYEFAAEDEKYYVKRSDLDQAFTISKTDYERITGKTRDTLSAPLEETADADANA